MSDDERHLQQAALEQRLEANLQELPHTSGEENEALRQQIAEDRIKLNTIRNPEKQRY